jgi:hypothetical protein
MGSEFNMFTCPSCRAPYQIIKVEAGPESDSREIVCLVCGGPVAAREGEFVLKYFLMRRQGQPARTGTCDELAARVLARSDRPETMP